MYKVKHDTTNHIYVHQEALVSKILSTNIGPTVPTYKQ